MTISEMLNGSLIDLWSINGDHIARTFSSERYSFSSYMRFDDYHVHEELKWL